MNDALFSNILRTYLVRDNGFTEIEANNEIYYIMSMIGTTNLLEGTDLRFGNIVYVFPSIPRHAMKDYIAMKKMNRGEKMKVAQSINNALNHSAGY
jgi:hypothetical protein